MGRCSDRDGGREVLPQLNWGEKRKSNLGGWETRVESAGKQGLNRIPD